MDKRVARKKEINSQVRKGHVTQWKRNNKSRIARSKAAASKELPKHNSPRHRNKAKKPFTFGRHRDFQQDALVSTANP